MGSPGQWSFQFPDSWTGESVLVVTTVEEGASFKMTVTDVDDEPDCEDEEEDPPPPEECDIDLICDSSRYFFSFVLGD